MYMYACRTKTASLVLLAHVMSCDVFGVVVQWEVGHYIMCMHVYA